MAQPSPGLPRAQLSRLEFRIRNLESKRRGLCARLGQTLFDKRSAAAPRQVVAEFQEARERQAEIAGLEAEEVALAAESAEVSRGARLAHSLSAVTGKGQDFARSVKVESRQKKLLAERAALLARLGRGIVARREDVNDELVDRLLAQAEVLEAEHAELEAEARALQQASAAMDPRLRKRVYWIAAGLVLLLIALGWWIALAILF